MRPNGQYIYPKVSLPKAQHLRVFLTGENVEPDMDTCDYAISFSRRVRNPRHFYLPLWAYENRAWGYGPDALVKRANTDWTAVAAQKTKFCNFLYSHDVAYRNALYVALSRYKHVDAAGKCMNNMPGFAVSRQPNRTAGKLEFIRPYKFTLAVEGFLSPGYTTEKLFDPLLADSVPIYVGDPLASETFNPDCFIDRSRFRSNEEMLDYVRVVDADDDLYVRMLSAAKYRANKIPDYARDDRILAFFDKIFEAAT